MSLNSGLLENVNGATFVLFAAMVMVVGHYLIKEIRAYECRCRIRSYSIRWNYPGGLRRAIPCDYLFLLTSAEQNVKNSSAPLEERRKVR